MSSPYHFVSDSCADQKCRVCQEPATHKLGEEIPNDEPCPACGEAWRWPDGEVDIAHAKCTSIFHKVTGSPRHNLTAYVCCDCFRMVVGDAAPCIDPEKPPYEDGFICGTGLDDPESASWTHEVYDTREEAIAAGNVDVTWRKHHDGFQTAKIRCQKTFMRNPFSAESECDNAEDDDMGEGMLERWRDKVFAQNGKLIDELQATLDKVWSDFEDKHKLFCWGIWMDDEQDHQFTLCGKGEPPCVLPPDHEGEECDPGPTVTKNDAGHNVVASPGVNAKIDLLARQCPKGMLCVHEPRCPGAANP